MTERRPLTDGLNSTRPSTPSVNSQLEREFVQGSRASEKTTTMPATPSPFSRVPISTRIRQEFAAALKRASLERQLNGVQPNTLQDILEQAIEPWLKSNGYIR
ncbi:MAG TPA: hypothetical protein VHX86_06220 [Tepidisphaeraceae bacterium]|nr:hypothetical protein [Tepidisphaeraceae bacterium]